MEYGAIVLLPPLATIILAVITKRGFEPLLLGATLGYVISDGFHFFGPWMEGIYTVFDADGVWLMLCVYFIGVFGFMIEKSGGSQGFGRVLAKFANTEKKALLLGWIIGIIMFVDDYANNVTVSSAIKPLSDRYKTPREMLAYVCNSTAAPVCILIPMSSWYVFFGGLVDAEECLQPFGSGFDIYKQGIPFMFYGWVALFMVVLVILGIVPKIGPMKKAYQRVAETGELWVGMNVGKEEELVVDSDDATNWTANEQVEAKMTADEKAGKKKRNGYGSPLNFIIPLAVVIAWTLHSDLLEGLILGTAAAGILFLINGTMGPKQFFNTIFDAVADMSEMFFIMMTAIFVKVSMDNIGLAEYVVHKVSPLLSANTFPVIVFIVVGALAFVTGNNWGVPAITIPMVAPLAVACSANIPLSIAALLSGAAFGSQACFYSDTTILASKLSGITNMEHALSQLPYAATSAVISIILFTIFGFVMA